MNWTKIEKLSALLANLGVLIGIVFLIVELNQNTRATESEAAWSRLEQGSALLERITNDAEFAEIYHNFVNMEPQDFPDSDPVEAERYGRYWGSYLLYWETRFLTQTSSTDRTALRQNIYNLLNGKRLVQLIIRDQNSSQARISEFQIFLADILAELESQQ